MRKLLFSMVLFTLAHIHTDGQHIVVEESDPFIYFACPANISFTILSLNNASSNQQQIIAACMSPKCDDYNIGVTNYCNGTDYIFKVNTKMVSTLRSLTKVQCVYDGKALFQYDILVYARPQNITCDVPFLMDNNKILSLTCTTTKVYPQAGCEVHVQNTALVIPGYTTMNNTMYNNTLVYYRSVCMWTSPMNNFQFGNYTFNFTFNVLLKNVLITVNMMAPLVMQFSLPNINLSSECFKGPNIRDGFIRSGANISCFCYLDFIGYPPGSVTWLDSSGQATGISLNTTTSILQIFPSNNTMKYNCTGTTSLNSGSRFIEYTVVYAKGPSRCNVGSNNATQQIWDLCYNKYINLSVVCTVDISDVNPSIQSIIYINSSASNILDSETFADTYKTKYETSVTVPGNITLGCQVQNTKFIDITSSCRSSQTVFVVAPPKSPPNLIIKPSTTEVKQIVQENKIYTVECSAPDGVPLVTNVKLSCGNISDTTQSGNNLTLPVMFTRNMTGQNCTCTAQHISKCYVNYTSQTQLNVTFGSKINTFITENMQTVLKNGTVAKLLCEADGNPPPYMYITKYHTIFSQNLSGHFVSYETLMMCRDSGVFECQSNNGIRKEDLQAVQTITVYVRCPLQLNNSEEKDIEFIHPLGESFVHTFTIYGYPEPSSITVSRNDTQTNNLQVKYSSLQIPYGLIQLTIPDVKLKDFTIYTVQIFQNEFNSLNYTLHLTVKEEKVNNKQDNIAAIVGGTVSALVVIVLILTLVLLVVRKKILIPFYCRCTESKSVENKRDENYSELSVCRRPEDQHTYQTPNINLSSSLESDQQAVSNKNYVNIQKHDVTYKNQFNSSSPYCNITDVNPNFQLN